MSCSRVAFVVALLTFGVSTAFGMDVAHVAACQRRINSEGARYAQKVIKSELRCTSAPDLCLINCESGLYGPVCDDQGQPSGCCDSDNPASNSTFQACLDAAQSTCDTEAQKVVKAEAAKSSHIRRTCSPPLVSAQEICSANTPGLHFATLAAGCQATIPGWECNGVDDVLSCVGGPLEKRLADHVSSLLDPRSGESMAALPPAIVSQFGQFPITRKIKEDLPAAGKIDVWRLSGLSEGDLISVRVETRDDTGTGIATLDPVLALLDSSAPAFLLTADTIRRTLPCPVTTVCGSACPTFRRTVPRSGTFFLAVTPGVSNGCLQGGKYKLVVTTGGGVVPQLVLDDVTGVLP